MIFDFFKKKEPQKNQDVAELKEDFSDISPIAKYFKNETGITFDKQESILRNKVVTFCKQKKIYSFENLLQSIKTDTDLKQDLIDTLTTNETFFYREFKQIEDLVRLVQNANKRVDILCAPSATGEEPYGIAIALLEAGIGNFHIIGIDINADAIKKAKIAEYKERNIRNLSTQIIERYFTKNDNLYLLNDRVKSFVTYKIVNLFDHSFTTIGKFDFIFSRNMLIYFDKETKLKAKSILESLRKDPNQEIFFGHADLF